MRRELDEYFAGRRREFELALDWALIGPFARRVLQATAAIPYGGVLSYAEVAAEAGSPRGSRAAGNALGANPIPIVIPCHRVLRSGGALGGYGGGLERKRWLLELEGAPPGRRRLRLRSATGAHCASAGSPSGMPSGAGTPGVSRRYHSASSAAWQPEPAAVIAWR